MTAYQLFNTFTNVSLPVDMTMAYTGNSANVVVTNIPPAVLQGYSLQQTNFGLQFATVSNQVYTVQGSSNGLVWQDITNFAAETTNFLFTIPIRTNAVEFFRVEGSGH